MSHDPGEGGTVARATPSGGSARGWAMAVPAAWLLGLSIRLWDVFVYRAACPTTKGGVTWGSCYRLIGDAAGFFGAAQLVRLGQVGMNPLLYNVTGGRIQATAAKPPMGVAWLALLSWFGDSPWLGQTIAAVVLLGLIFFGVRRHWGRVRALMVVEIGIVVFFALRIVGGTTVQSARFFSVLLGSLAIPLMAAVARRAAPSGWGQRCAAITAVIVAIHPAIWVGDSMLNNETVLVVMLPLFLLATYHALDRPSVESGVWLALSFTGLVLTRVELAGLGLFVLVPLAWSMRDRWRPRVRQAGAFAAVTVLCFGIYGSWNRLRLGPDGGVSPTSVAGYVLNAGSCDPVFSGDAKGLWLPCWILPQVTSPADGERTVGQVVDRLVGIDGYAARLTDPEEGVVGITTKEPPVDLFDGFENLDDIRSSMIDSYGVLPDGTPGVGMWVNDVPVADPSTPVGAGDEVTFKFHFYFMMVDEPLTAAAITPPTLDYLSEHRSELPGVVAARLGRVIGLYNPSDTMTADAGLEGRGWLPSRAGFWFLWVLAPLGVLGGVVLRQHRRPLAPLVGPIVNVALVVAVTFGLARYRLAADLSLAVLAAVGIARLVAAARSEPARPADDVGEVDLDDTAGADTPREHSDVS
ncbi:MAG: glycosyltransferase family 39 protein [Microthrixaceae bacterium]